MSTLVEFVIAATDCTGQEVTDPAKCNLLAEKVGRPDPGALTTRQTWLWNRVVFCSLHLGAEEIK